MYFPLKFLFYFFQSNIYLLQAGFIGLGLKHLSKEYLRNLKIPLPPLDIQEKIVAECENLEKNKSQLMTEGMSMKDFEKAVKEKKKEIMQKYL